MAYKFDCGFHRPAGWLAQSRIHRTSQQEERGDYGYKPKTPLGDNRYRVTFGSKQRDARRETVQDYALLACGRTDTWPKGYDWFETAIANEETGKPHNGPPIPVLARLNQQTQTYYPKLRPCWVTCDTVVSGGR